MDLSTVHPYGSASSHASYDQWAEVCHVSPFIDDRISQICPSLLPFTCFPTFLCHCASYRRPNDQLSPHVVKRQRVNTAGHHLIRPTLIHSPPPHHRSDRAVAEPSRLSLTGFEPSYPSPHLDVYPQVPVVPESSGSLHACATDKVNSGLDL